MKPFHLLLLIFILSQVWCHGQDVPGRWDKDSLQRILQQTVSDSVKAGVNFLLAEELMERDTAAAGKYVMAGTRLGQAYPYWQAVALLYQARLLEPVAPDSAAALLMQAETRLKGFSGREAVFFRSMCWHDYARVYHLEKDDPETYVDLMLNRAIPLVRESGDKLYLGKNYLDLAYGFKNLQEFSKAESYLLRAIETLRNEKGNGRYLAAAYHTISENYSLSGKPVPAAAYLDSMRQLLTPYPHALSWLDYYAGESMRLTIAEKFDESLLVSAKGIGLARQLRQPYPEQRLLLQKFYALYNKNDLRAARDVALDLLGRQPFISNSSNRLQVFYGLVVTYEGIGDIPAAYGWLKQYSRLKDSLSKSNLEARVNALEVKFRNAEHQREIVQLNAANDKANFELRRTRLMIWAFALISVLLLTLLLLGYYFYRSRKKTAAQRERIRVSHAMLRGQEDERQRVARDLHDGLGGMLTAVKLHLAERTAGASGSSGVDGVQRELDDAIKELRRIAHNMMPEMLIRLGLEAALKDLCDSFVSETTVIRFQCFDIGRDIPVQEQVIIYRIAQELLANTVKHASATQVLLQCNQRAQLFFLTVEDDGIGLDASARGQSQGMGFTNIRNRVAYLNGRMDIVPGMGGKGVSINIEVYVTGEI